MERNSAERPPLPPIPEELKTVQELSEITGYTTRHLVHLIQIGQIDAHRVGNKSYLTTEAQVRFYMENNPNRKHDAFKNYIDRTNPTIVDSKDELPFPPFNVFE